MNTLLRILLFFTWSSILYAQKYSNSFLELPVGAASAALGKAVVAMPNNVFSVFTNPATIPQKDNKYDYQIGLQHTESFGGVAKLDHLGFIYPFDKKKKYIALSLLRYAIDDIPNTFQLIAPDGSYNFAAITPFSAIDLAFLTTYSQRIWTRKGYLSIGANAKIIHRRVGSFAEAWGFGVEAGLAYKINNLRLGLFVNDLSNTFNAWKYSFSDDEKNILTLTGNKIPSTSLEVTRPRVSIGGAYLLSKDVISFQPMVNFTYFFDGKRNTIINLDSSSIDINVGAELGFFDKVYLRSGISNFQYYKIVDKQILTYQPSFGIGIKFYNIVLEYAFTQLRTEFSPSYSHIISFLYNVDKNYFNKPKKYKYK
ncbi:MAG: hypothetical protein KBA06_00505 [Saprospiraceae bacterium]|nr:hypothetical protein [Saprospiraceae bacterium]